MSPMPGSYISDESGEPRVFYMKGGDASDPNKVIPVYQEVRPGGMLVARALPASMGRITVAADPLGAPTLAQVEAERRERQIQNLDRERAALAAERGDTVQPNPSAGTPEDAARAAAAEGGSEDEQLRDDPAQVPGAGEDAQTEPEEDEQERAEREARESAARKAGTGSGSRRRTTARSK